MNRIDAEVDTLKALGATTGQIEHRLIELGVRDDDEPSADGEWWWKHREAQPTCCGPNHPDGYVPKSQG